MNRCIIRAAHVVTLPSTTSRAVPAPRGRGKASSSPSRRSAAITVSRPPGLAVAARAAAPTTPTSTPTPPAVVRGRRRDQRGDAHGGDDEERRSRGVNLPDLHLLDLREGDALTPRGQRSIAGRKIVGDSAQPDEAVAADERVFDDQDSAVREGHAYAAIGRRAVEALGL